MSKRVLSEDESRAVTGMTSIVVFQTVYTNRDFDIKVANAFDISSSDLEILKDVDKRQ
jgi:hypothetical protein